MARAAAAELTALEHLHELVRRLLWSVGFLFVGGVVAYVFRLKVIDFLQRPLHQNLYYTSPMGSFQFVMQVCVLCGVLCALPILLYNVLRFIEPAFMRRFTRRMMLTLLSSSLLLTLIGAAFAYYLTLPMALRFFGTVGTSDLHPLISVNEYFSFILGYLATFAVVFQLPLILLFIDHIHPFGPSALRKKRTPVYVAAFAISLIMPSSPDPLSQVSLAIPIIALYELSILLIFLAQRKRQRRRGNTKLQTSADYTQPARVASSFNFDSVAPVMVAAGNSVAAAKSQQQALMRRHQRRLPVNRTQRLMLNRTKYRDSFQVASRNDQPVTRAIRPEPRIIADIL